MILCQSDQQHQQYNSTFFDMISSQVNDWNVPAYPQTHAFTPEFARKQGAPRKEPS